MHRIKITILLWVLLGGIASSEDVTASDTHPWNGEVRVHGALRAMFHEGQTGVMVTLDEMLPNPDLYAVGALADLSGEITIVGGKLFLAYPLGAEETRTETLSRSDAGATLLVVAEVPAWRGVSTEKAIRFEELDEEIGRLASAAGMSLEARFPFLLQGDFEDLRWHVIDGRRLSDGGTSHEDHLAAAVGGEYDRVSATLVGFYSSRDQGVFTHKGSRTHLHCVVDDPLLTGHVDHVVIPAGTTIRFPAGEGERLDQALQTDGAARQH